MERMVYARYQELQQYVGWGETDVARVTTAAPLVASALPALIDDFYAVIQRHPEACQVITGGAEQVARLKQTLLRWIQELLAGTYDRDYVDRRWRVGWRHVEVGLSQVYTNVALARLRSGLIQSLAERWQGDAEELSRTVDSLNKLLDLDLAIIEEAYRAEYSKREQQSQRLATIGQVAGGIAHELRNPLNVVKTSVYYLRNARQLKPDKMAEHLDRIERQVQLADGVITALTDFARLPLPDAVPLSVEECMRATLEDNPVPESVAVEWNIPPDAPPVLGDARQLGIVFGNLVRNARDAMPDGGRLAIFASAVDSDVEVTLADTGHGIKPEDIARIMEPLYSTKARGIGLGLAITKAILEKHHGALRVSSELGQGAAFTVVLPAATARDQRE